MIIDQTIVGEDIPSSPLASALKCATVVRCRKFYPTDEIIRDFGHKVHEDMFAWVVGVEDIAIVRAVEEAVVNGKIHSCTVLDAGGVEEILNRNVPMLAYGYCPKCFSPLHIHMNEHYCGHCGQAVEWVTAIKDKDGGEANAD